jgi:hypothetical protein
MARKKKLYQPRMLSQITYKVKRPGTRGCFKRIHFDKPMKVVTHQDGIQFEKEAYDAGWHSIKTLTEPPEWTSANLLKMYELGRLHRLRLEDELRRRKNPGSALHQVDNYIHDLQKSRSLKKI